MALYMCQASTPYGGFSGVSPDGNCAYEVLLRPTQSHSDEPSDLRGSLSTTSVYSTRQSRFRQSQAVTHPITVCDTNARPSPVILAPGEYTVSGTGPAGRVYIQNLICLCNVTRPILVLSACLTSAWIGCISGIKTTRRRH